MVPVPFWRRPPSPFVMWYLCHKPTTSVKFLSKSLFHSISLLSIPLMTRGCPHCHSFYEARTSHTTGLAALFFLKNVWLIFGSSWSESVCQFPNETTKAKPAGILTGITWKPEFKLRRTNIFTRSHSPGLVSTWARTTLTHCQGACRLVQSLENCQLSAEADHMPPLQPNPSILGMSPTAREHLHIPGDVHKRHQQHHAERLRTGTYASWRSVTSRTGQYYIHTTEHPTATRMNQLTHKDMDETRRYNVEWKQHTQERSRAEMRAVHNENTNRHKSIIHWVTSKWKKT